MPWLSFESTVAETKTLAQPEAILARSTMNDTAAYVGSHRCCSHIFNSMPR